MIDRRQRNFKPDPSTPYVANLQTVGITNGHLTAEVQNTKNSKLFVLDLYQLRDNRFRFRFNEMNPLKKRYEVEGVIIDDLQQERYILTLWSLVNPGIELT